MKYDEMIAALKLEGFEKVLNVDWNLSGKTYPDGKIPFLEDDFIRDIAETGGLSPSVAEHLISQVVPEIKKNPYLSRLMWHQYYLLYVSQNPEKPNSYNFPHINWILNDDDAHSYNLLLAMAGYPHAMEIHRKLGIPEDICKDTYTDLEVWCDFYKQSQNIIGFPNRILCWLQNHLNGKLFRIGRFQYIHEPLHYKFNVFRNINTSAVVAFADPGRKIDSQGLCDGVNGKHDPNAWETEYVETADFAEGNPILPEGYISKEKKRLCLLNDWKKVLSEGDGVLDIHIPAIGSMSTNLCANSLAAAAEFFPKYFPGKPFKGFVCTSWFLDNQFEKLLNETSNIIKLQREFYLFPVPVGGHKETIWRVFGDEALKAAPKDYPKNTSMQNSFADFVEAGGKFRTGGAFFLKDDLPFGRQIYKKKA